MRMLLIIVNIRINIDNELEAFEKRMYEKDKPVKIKEEKNSSKIA